MLGSVVGVRAIFMEEEWAGRRWRWRKLRGGKVSGIALASMKCGAVLRACVCRYVRVCM